jgi:RHS repeat-associated protein
VGSGDCAALVSPNRVVTNSYSSKGNLLTEETKGCNDDEPFTYTTTYTYDESSTGHGHLLTVNGPRNDATDVVDQTTYAYYAHTDALNDRGRLKRVTNALGQHTDFSGYDLFGNVGTVTQQNVPEDVVSTYLYDGKDRPTEVRLHGAVASDDIVTRYQYDAVGNLHRLRLPNCVDPCEFSLEYEYDAVNRLMEVHDAVGNKILYSYDVESNRIREEYKDVSAVAQRFTNFEYDAFNRLQRICYDAMTPGLCGPVFDQFSYYADGTRHTEQDPLGHTTTFQYDEFKRTMSVARSLGAGSVTTAYTYDTLDGLKTVTDPNGVTTTYTNGDLGWLLKAVSPDSGTWKYSYDSAGNLLTTLSANLVTTTRAYDATNRLTTVTFSGAPSLTVTHSYDSAAVSFGIGRRTGLVDASGTSTFGYDRRGLLKTEQRNTGGLTYLTGYDYDNTGNLTEVRFPTSNPGVRQGIVDYGYDPADRVSSVKTRLAGATTTIADAFEYKPFGPRTRMTLSGVTDSRVLDTRYRLETWTLGTLLRYTHTYDNDNNLLTVADNLNPSPPHDRTFGYDDLGRLIAATGPWAEASTCPGGATYVYDANGNRTCKGETGASTNYVLAAGTNRIAASSGGETRSYVYDNNGNIISDGVSFHYSQADRLAAVGGTTYKYDGDNRRTTKTASGNTTIFFYDPSGRLIQEFVPATGVGKDYIYLDGAPLARVDWILAEQDIGNVLRVNKAAPNVQLDWSQYLPAVVGFSVRRKIENPGDGTFDGAALIATLDNTTRTFSDPELNTPVRLDYRVFKLAKSEQLFYYHTDHLGTPIAMSNGREFVWRAEYFPFGGLFSNTVSDVENNLRFPGQYVDAETGLHQNWFRDYSPRTGRYQEPDPVGLADSVNAYEYVHQEPIDLTDPYGLLSVGDSCNSRCESDRNALETTVTAFNNFWSPGWGQRHPRCRQALIELGAKYDAAFDPGSPIDAAMIRNGRNVSVFPALTCMSIKSRSMVVECEPNGPRCGGPLWFGKYHPNVAWVHPLGFDPICGSLLNTVFHELLHNCGVPSEDHPDDWGPASQVALECLGE